MTSRNKAPTDEPDHTPNFDLSRHDVIHEDNWLEYEAKGFRPVTTPFDYAQSVYGIEHVYTGDEYDYEAERPLRHKPGTGVYVDSEGLKIGAKDSREWEEWHRRRSEDQRSDGGPAAN
jgi:hypothetical protein